MKTIIGRIDKADFPGLSLTNLKVKIDTGARTSSIHCHEIKEIERDGEMMLRFKLLDPTHPKYKSKEFEVTHYKKKKVKSSIGKSEQRFIFTTDIILFGEKTPIELSLSNRKQMKFPVLLGRKLLNKRFIVDTAKQNLSFKMKQKSK